MGVIAISRQVAALGDEVAAEVAEKLGYKFINRQELEKRIVAPGRLEVSNKNGINLLDISNVNKLF